MLDLLKFPRKRKMLKILTCHLFSILKVGANNQYRVGKHQCLQKSSKCKISLTSPLNVSVVGILQPSWFRRCKSDLDKSMRVKDPDPCMDSPQPYQIQPCPWATYPHQGLPVSPVHDYNKTQEGSEFYQEDRFTQLIVLEVQVQDQAAPLAGYLIGKGRGKEKE